MAAHSAIATKDLAPARTAHTDTDKITASRATDPARLTRIGNHGQHRQQIQALVGNRLPELREMADRRVDRR